MIIGIDFDNTIVNYDELIFQIALEKKIITPNTIKIKKEIRDHIRQLPEGEIKWQKVQAIAYGSRITQATLAVDIESFFQECKKRKIPFYIISHKTNYANHDTNQTNLREAALRWMEQKNFFSPYSFNLKKGEVFFENTRISKIERIKSLGCTHFIDDLEETFLEKTFPTNVEKILFSPHPLTSPNKIKYGNWKEIKQYIFP